MTTSFLCFSAWEIPISVPPVRDWFGKANTTSDSLTICSFRIRIARMIFARVLQLWKSGRIIFIGIFNRAAHCSAFRSIPDAPPDTKAAGEKLRTDCNTNLYSSRVREPITASVMDTLYQNPRRMSIEISPAYVAVALQRWADHTGNTPKLIKANK